MKMSECFNLPLFAKCERDYTDEYVQNVYDNSGDILLPCVPDDVDHEAIVKAVNSHDQMSKQLEKCENGLNAICSILDNENYTHFEKNHRITNLLIVHFDAKLLEKE